MPPNPQGPSFSERQKRKQKIVQGENPLKIPQGGALWPRPPFTPTAGNLGDRSKHSKSTESRKNVRLSYYARVYNALLTLYHIPDQLSTATEYFLLSEFQRRYDA